MSARILGNGTEIPMHAEYLEYLGVLPVKARIYRIDDDEEPWPWQLDGFAIVDGQFAVTSTCWNFPTRDEAIAAMPEFWRAVQEVTL
jgi:hypothetical protein